VALVTGAIPAALGAGWVSNLFARDRSRLLLVVALAEASAVVVFLVVLASALLPGPGQGFVGPLTYTLWPSAP